jgi:prolyl-tRNA synthetase
VVVVLVRDENGTGPAAAGLVDELRRAGVRVRLDDRVETSFGRRSVDWELKGVPVRIEVGPRELAAGQVTVVRRDIQRKQAVFLAGVQAEVGAALEAAQAGLYAAAAARLADGTRQTTTVGEAAAAAAEGFAVIPWARLGERGEEELASRGVSVRCLQMPDGSLAEAEDASDLVAVVAKAY